MSGEASEAPGLRERRREQSRTALVESALRLMAKRGFDGVSVEEIAEDAGVSRRTFFRYFETKESVLFDRRRSQLAAFEAALASASPDAAPFEVIEAALLELGREYQRDRERILKERALFMTSRDLGASDHQLDRDFEEAIVKAIVRTTGSSKLAVRNARYFAAAAIAVLRVAITEWAEAGGKTNLVATARPAFALLAKLMPFE